MKQLTWISIKIEDTRPQEKAMTLQVDMETRENKYRKNQQIQERKAIKHKITLKQ